MCYLTNKLTQSLTILTVATMLASTACAGVASTAVNNSSHLFANLSAIHAGIATTWTSGNYLDTSSHHLIYPAIGYMGDRLSVVGPTAAYRLIGPKFMHVAIAGSLLPNEFDPKDSTNAKMQKLNKRNYTVAAGLRGVLIMKSLGAFSVTAKRAFFAGDGGYFATAAFTTRLQKELGPAKVSFMPSLGAEYYSQKLANYYYGISKAESTKSGLKTYSPTSAIAPYVNVALLGQFTSRVRAYVAVRVARMPDVIMDSPMVSKRYGYTTTAAITYAL
jgi:outer membrane protein